MICNSRNFILKTMKEFSFLLSRGFRLWGFIFTFLGTILGIMRFYFGVKPGILDQKVYAIYSVFLETKTMRTIKNQMIEEIVGILLIIGLFLIAFTREKIENQQVNSIRLKAFFISIYINTAFLIASLIFTFGFAFVYMMILDLILPLSIYIISFQIMLAIERNKKIKKRYPKINISCSVASNITKITLKPTES